MVTRKEALLFVNVIVIGGIIGMLTSVFGLPIQSGWPLSAGMVTGILYHHMFKVDMWHSVLLGALGALIGSGLVFFVF